MNDRMTDVRRIMCEGIQSVAEAKLQRSLSPGEAAGMWNISSLMLLEAIERHFRESSTSAAAIVRELAYFTRHTKEKQ